MKSKKPSMIIVVALFLLAVEVVWFYLSRQEELPAPVPATAQIEPDKPVPHYPSPMLKNASIDTENHGPRFQDSTGYFDLNGLTVSQYVNRYREAANKGDNMAAFNIYRVESICTRIPELQKNIDSMRYNTQEIKAKEAMQRSLNEVQSVCGNFKIDENERWHYLFMAAKGGVTAAQLAYANNPPAEINRLYQRDLTNPRVVQWQKEAVGFLTQAGNSGDLVALTELATIYDTGRMAPQDRQLALTYRMALALINKSNFNPDITRLSGQLTPDQVNAAYAAATELVNSCCDKF